MSVAHRSQPILRGVVVVIVVLTIVGLAFSGLAAFF